MSDESNVPSSAPETAPDTSTNNTEESKDKAEAVVTPPRMLKYKANGKEIEEPEDEVLKKASLSHAAYEKFQEAAREKKEVQATIAQLKADPIGTLKHLGLTTSQIQEVFEPWFKSEVLEPAMLTPEQRQANEKERLLAKYQKEEQARIEKEREAKQQQIQQYHIQKYQTDMIKSLEGAGLPATEEAVQRMAYYAKQALAAGVDAPMDMIAEKVKQDMSSSLNKLVAKLSPEQLLQMFGSDVANKIRKHDLEQYRKASPVRTTNPAYKSGSNNNQSKEPKILDEHEWRAKYRR